jgi:hypothetical protein
MVTKTRSKFCNHSFSLDDGILFVHNFNLFCIHLIYKGYDPSAMEIVNTEIGLQIYVRTYIHTYIHTYIIKHDLITKHLKSFLKFTNSIEFDKL